MKSVKDMAFVACCEARDVFELVAGGSGTERADGRPIVASYREGGS